MIRHIGTKPGYYYQLRVCNRFQRFHDDNSLCFQFLRAEYETYKKIVDREEVTIQAHISYRMDLFLFAVGLFAFGDLQAVYDIIENAPIGYPRLTGLAKCVVALLPLPDEFGTWAYDENMEHLNFRDVDKYIKDWFRNNKKALQEWIHDHENDLQWDPEAYRYVFKQDEK